MIDLHTHSRASDGELTAPELLTEAAATGVRVLALTDHDTVTGLGQAAAAALARGVTLVPGVELSTTWEGSGVHVVGLGIDPEAAVLTRGLSRLQQERRRRAELIDRRLLRLGIPGALAGAEALAGGLVTRAHFARHLVAAGHAKDAAEVFKRLLGRGKPAHVAGEWAPLSEAVAWIRSAGGVAVLAHPQRYRLTATRLRRLVEAFKEAGGTALEVITGRQPPTAALVLAGLARRFGLLASLGSDFHGPGMPWGGLGRLPALPAGVDCVWRDGALVELR